MSKTLFLTLLIASGTVLAQPAAAPKKFMAIMGGGAEPVDKETTIFDADIRNLGRFVNRATEWKPTISFNGGHTTTEGLIRRGIGRRNVANTHFTKEQYEATIADYKRKILAGEIKSGDQLMVWISTHGAKNNGEASHSISASGGGAVANLETLAGSPLVSMDLLQDLINTANQSGVKLAIMDFSCHSGNSMALSNPNTCIISSSGPNHFGYSNWGGLFAGNMRAGRNLEETFLQTLNSRTDPGFPMISSPVGKEVQNEIYPLATPFYFWYSNKDGHNKLSPFLENQVVKNQCEEADRSFQSLLDFSRDVEAVVGTSGKNTPNYSTFRNAVHEYQNLLEQMRTDLQALNIADLETRTEPVCAPFQNFYPDGSPAPITEECRNKPFTHKEMLAMDWPAEITRLSKIRDEATVQSTKNWLTTQTEWFVKGQARTAQILAENPNYGEYLNYYKNQPNLETRTRDLAEKVSKATQRLYTDLYRARSRADTRPNPCKNFVM